MRCNNCGSLNNKEDKFCWKCGSPVAGQLPVSPKNRTTAGILCLVLSPLCGGELYLGSKDKFFGQLIRAFYIIAILLLIEFLRSLTLTLMYARIVKYLIIVLQLSIVLIAVYMIVVCLLQIIKAIRLFSNAEVKDAQDRVIQ